MTQRSRPATISPAGRWTDHTPYEIRVAPTTEIAIVRPVRPAFARFWVAVRLRSLDRLHQATRAARFCFQTGWGVNSRSEERLVGKGCVRTGRSRWAQYH